jgi:hypothetical protein
LLCAKTAHVGPRAMRGGLAGESCAPAVPVATGANVGVRGPVVAQKKGGGRTGGHPTTAEYMRDEPAWHTKIMTRGRQKSSERRRA